MFAIMARLLLERSAETPDSGSDDSADFLATLASELDKGEDQ